jgi:hypothetical protein
VPAAAVIPAPIACAKVVAVKKLVVELLAAYRFGFSRLVMQSSVCKLSRPLLVRLGKQTIYLEKIRVFQAGNRRNTLAWNNGIGLSSFVGFRNLVMINRNSWGH